MKTVTTYTDAPRDYDGFGSFTARVVGRTPRGELREVVTPAEHADWQRQRYLSGPYLVCHDEARLRQIAAALGVELLPPGEAARRAVRDALARLLEESAGGLWDAGPEAWRQAVAAMKQAKEAS